MTREKRMTTEEYRKLNSSERRGGDGRRRGQPEHDSQATFFAVIDLPENRRRFPFLQFVAAVPNGGFRHSSTARLLKKEGVRAGFPDVVFPFCRRGYPGAYLENKFGKNRLSPEQIAFRDHLVGEGYCFKTCYTTEEQIEFAEWYLGIELIK